MSGGYARASGAGAGSAGNTIEFEDPIDDARVKVTGLKRKHERLIQAHSELVSRIGLDAARGADEIVALELADAATQQRLAQVQAAAASTRSALVTARCTQHDLAIHGADTARVSSKRVQRAQVDVQYAEVTLAELEAAEATAAEAAKAEATLAAAAAAVAALEPEPDDVECSVCLENIAGRELQQIKGCTHSFCDPCILELIADVFIPNRKDLCFFRSHDLLGLVHTKFE